MAGTPRRESNAAFRRVDGYIAPTMRGHDSFELVVALRDIHEHDELLRWYGGQFSFASDNMEECTCAGEWGGRRVRGACAC